MQITCLCVAGLPGQPETAASVNGDVITVNGTAFDLSVVPDGGYAEPQGDHPFVGMIERIAGELHFALRWSYDADKADLVQLSANPVQTVLAGPVPDPVVRLPQPEEV